jgi:hypothetical protein
MTIFVETPTGQTLKVEIEPSETVWDLKQKIQSRVGFPTDMQHTYRYCKELEKNDQAAF